MNHHLYASTVNVHFRKMLSVTFEPMTLKMSSVSRGSGNVHSFWRYVSQSAYVTICGLSLAVTLTFDLLTSKSNQFIFVSNCTEVINLAKFKQTV